MPITSYKLAVSIGVVLFLLAKFYYMQTEIDKGLLEIEAMSATISNKDLVIGALEASIASSSATIDKLNEENAKYKDSSIMAKNKLDAWRASSKLAKYKSINKKINPDNSNLATANCEKGIKLNKYISELSYENL